MKNEKFGKIAAAMTADSNALVKKLLGAYAETNVELVQVEDDAEGFDALLCANNASRTKYVRKVAIVAVEEHGGEYVLPKERHYELSAGADLMRAELVYLCFEDGELAHVERRANSNTAADCDDYYRIER